MESTIIREFKGRVVFIRFIVAPLVFHAVTLLDRDGNYNMYLNADLSEEARMEAVEHELAHIENGDLESELPGSLIELMREEV